MNRLDTHQRVVNEAKKGAPPTFNERFNLTPPPEHQRCASKTQHAILAQIEKDMHELEDLAAIAPDRCYYPADDDSTSVREQGTIDEDPFEPLPGNVEMMPVITRHKFDAARTLRHAHEAGLEEIIILGYTKDGSEFFSSNMPDGAESVWHLERAKLKLLQMNGNDLRDDGDEPTPPKERA